MRHQTFHKRSFVPLPLCAVLTADQSRALALARDASKPEIHNHRGNLWTFRIMARSRTSQPPAKQPAQLSVGDMQSALPKLQRRIIDVAAVDPNGAGSTHTPEFEAINDAVNATLIDIFGQDSIEYDRYSSRRLYAGGYYVNGTPHHEIIEGYEEGKKRVLVKLDSAIKFINERLSDLGVGNQSSTPRSLAGIDLHPAIEQAAGQLFRDGHFANAVENSCKALNNLVQMRSGNYQLDNTRLMSAVFSKK